MTILERVQSVSKLLVHIVAAVGFNAIVAVASGGLTPELGVSIVLSIITAISVYKVSNAPQDERNAEAVTKAYNEYVKTLEKTNSHIGVEDVVVLDKSPELDNSTEAVMPEANTLMAGNPSTEESR